MKCDLSEWWSRCEGPLDSVSYVLVNQFYGLKENQSFLCPVKLSQEYYLLNFVCKYLSDIQIGVKYIIWKCHVSFRETAVCAH